MNVEEIRWYNVEWIHHVLNKDVYMIMNGQTPQARNFMTSSVTISLKDMLVG
jgi:hypothetical protein